MSNVGKYKKKLAVLEARRKAHEALKISKGLLDLVHRKEIGNI